MTEVEQFEEFDNDLAELEKDIRAGIKMLAKLKGEKRDDKIKYLEGRIKRMRVIHRTYKVEMRVLEKDQRKTYESNYATHEETITRLVQDLDWAKADGERAELMKGGTEVVELTSGQKRDKMLDKADAIQKEDLSAIERMKGKVAETQQIGAETAQKMHSQMEQLASTTEVLDEQGLLLKEGSLQLRAFARRIASVFTLVVVVIVISSFAPDLLSSAIKVPDILQIPTKFQLPGAGLTEFTDVAAETTTIVAPTDAPMT